MLKRAPSKKPAAQAEVVESVNFSRGLPVIIALLALAIIGWYFTSRSDSSLKMNGNTAQIVNGGADDLKTLINRVGDLVSVPANEIPSVATIANIDTLRAQNPILYRDAENGDKLLVWSDKSVVYSTKKDKVLTVMPLVRDQADVQYVQRLVATLNGQAPATSTTSPSADDAFKTTTIEVRNGTATSGKAKLEADRLQGQFNVLAPTNANKRDYSSSIVFVNKASASKEVIDELIKETGATIVTTLPGELNLKGDIIYIVGPTN